MAHVPAVVTSGSNGFTSAVPQALAAVGGVNVGVDGQSIVAFAPASLIVGAVLPRTVIDCDFVAEWLPQASVASHLTVVVVDVQASPTEFLLSSLTVAPLQASDAVGFVKVGVTPQSIVALSPASPMVGP